MRLTICCRSYVRGPLCVGLSVLCVVGLAGQGGGIRPVTAADAAQAIELGRSHGPIVGYAPLLDRLRALQDAQQPPSYPGPSDEEAMHRFLRATPFFFSIRSPYCQIASRARSGLDAAQLPTAEEANQNRVIVDAMPGPDISTADDVKDVFIRRGDKLWKPVKFQPHRTTMRSGSTKKTFAYGSFTFPFAVFDPSLDITVVIVGSRRHLEWTIVREELAAMR